MVPTNKCRNVLCESPTVYIFGDFNHFKICIGNTFTQADVSAGLITYVHGGNNNTSPDGFTPLHTVQINQHQFQCISRCPLRPITVADEKMAFEELMGAKKG